MDMIIISIDTINNDSFLNAIFLDVQEYFLPDVG